MHESVAARQVSGAIVSAPARTLPDRVALAGRYARIEPIDPDLHADGLWAASHTGEDVDRIWDYLGYGPFQSIESFRAWLYECASSDDPLFFAIRDLRDDQTAGMASYLEIRPTAGVIEIGHIWLALSLQRSRAATEALYLMMRHAMDDFGYRRLEWKCNALNQASRRAANRLGFAFDGIFYQHMVVKGRNRDTAWFSILDSEWPILRENFEAWLAPDNFDDLGGQIQSLSDMNRRSRTVSSELE